MRLHVALLDIDGTLIDSNDAHAACWVEALARFGYNVEFARVRRLIGKGGDKLLPEVSGLDKDSERAKEILEYRRSLFLDRYVPRLRPFADARALLVRMREQGLELVVATSAHEQELDPLLQVLDAKELLSRTTSSSDANHSKPDRDIIEVALSKCGANPEDAIMLGDTPYDIEAAARARVPTVALRCGGWNDDELRGALAVYDDPADLLCRFAESPLAQASPMSAPSAVPPKRIDKFPVES